MRSFRVLSDLAVSACFSLTIYDAREGKSLLEERQKPFSGTRAIRT